MKKHMFNFVLRHFNEKTYLVNKLTFGLKTLTSAKTALENLGKKHTYVKERKKIVFIHLSTQPYCSMRPRMVFILVNGPERSMA